MAHPWALRLGSLQSLVERGVDENTSVVFPASLRTTIAVAPIPVGTVNGASESS
jgi:hypothetical protein